MINQSIRAGALRVAALVLGVASMLNAGTAPAGAQEVTLYSTREAALTTPILGKFTSQTGIPVNFVQFKTINELMEKLAKDGDRSTADMAIIPDIGGLFDLVSARLTQPVQSRELDSAIPPNLKHPTNMWVALSYRIRAIYVSKDRVADRPTTSNADGSPISTSSAPGVTTPSLCC